IPVLSIATWRTPSAFSQSTSSSNALVVVGKVLTRRPWGVMTAATTDFLWTSNPLTYSRTLSNWLLPPSRTWSDVGRTVLFEESLQRAPASGHGNNSRSLSIGPPAHAPPRARGISERPGYFRARPSGGKSWTNRHQPDRVTTDPAVAPGQGFSRPQGARKGVPLPRHATPRSRLRGDPGRGGECDRGVMVRGRCRVLSLGVGYTLIGVVDHRP